MVVQLAQGSVYSLHKRSTREQVKKHALGVLGAGVADVVAELNYDLPATFKHHKCDPCAFCYWYSHDNVRRDSLRSVGVIVV